jgi:uncharacterized protein (DUF427 family)
MSTQTSIVTLVKNAIHNPADVRHFMRLSKPGYVITASANGRELARSEHAVKLKEVGMDIYDTAIYFPRDDVQMAVLSKNAKTSHCPLKGDTEYFDCTGDGAQLDNVAWSYDRTIEIAVEIKGLICFDARLVQIVEHTVVATR